MAIRFDRDIDPDHIRNLSCPSSSGIDEKSTSVLSTICSDLVYPVVLNVESPISRSFVYVGVLATNTQLFEWADYKYTIVPSVVYFVGLN